MPRILEMRIIENEVWVRLPTSESTDSGMFYIWTKQEAKDAEASAIRSFLFDLGNKYIEDNNIDKPS